MRQIWPPTVQLSQSFPSPQLHDQLSLHLEYPRVPRNTCEISVPSGKAAPTPLPGTMRPDSLLKMTLGGVTLTLLQTSAPSSGPPDLATHFFAEFDASKDGPFGSRDFHHLRPRFQRACPCSHVRYDPQPKARICRDSQSPHTHPLTPTSFLIDSQAWPCSCPGSCGQAAGAGGQPAQKCTLGSWRCWSVCGPGALQSLSTQR
jgi:hypothetical protein